MHHLTEVQEGQPPIHIQQQEVIQLAPQEQELIVGAEVLVQGLRDSVAAISSQSELAQNLIKNQISGPAYLKDLESEKEEPLLILPA